MSARDPLVFHLHCRHFTGVTDEKCKAGVVYREQFPPPWNDNGLGCIEHCDARCPKAEYPTREEAQAELDRSLKETAERMACVVAAKADAKRRGFKKGNGGTGEIECPRCHGPLRYTVAALNGHMWANCACGGWIE